MEPTIAITVFYCLITIACIVIVLILLQENKYIHWRLDDIMKCHEDIINNQNLKQKNIPYGSSEKTI